MTLSLILAAYLSVAPADTPTHVSGAVTVLTAEELDAQPYVTLLQILQHCVSLQISSQSLHGRQSFPTVRGSAQVFGSGIVLFVDGQRIRESFYGSPFVFARYFPAAAIDTLTVARGTAATSWAGDGVDAVIDIRTRRDLQAGLLLGQNGATTVSLQRGVHGVLPFGAGPVHSLVWLHSIDDDGFRQRVRDAAGNIVSTIDSGTNHSYGASVNVGGFFADLHGSYYGSRRSLVYGFKSHSNRARHSQLSLTLGYQNSFESGRYRVSAQIAESNANSLGLVAPAGIRPRAIATPLTEDYLLNEWMGQLEVGVRGQAHFELTRSWALGVEADVSVSGVRKAKQKGTHDPETFDFVGTLDDHGKKGVNLPSGARRLTVDTDVTAHYTGPFVRATIGVRVRRIEDSGFMRDPPAAFAVLPNASVRWDYRDGGHIWAGIGSTLDAPPWSAQHLENHPLWAARSFYGDLPDLKPERSYKAELGVRESWSSLHTTVVAFFNETRNQLRYAPGHELLYVTEEDCPPWECIPVQAFVNRRRAGHAGVEWTVGGRLRYLSLDLHLTQLITSWETGYEDPATFSHTSGGLRATIPLANHRIGVALSVFDAFSNTLIGHEPYGIVDLRWSYQITDWVGVSLTASNILNRTPGGLRRTMPNGYSSRGTMIVAQLRFREAEL